MFLVYVPVKFDLIFVPLETVEGVIKAVLQHVIAALQHCSIAPLHCVRHSDPL